MTKKQRRFIEEYLIDVNATQAAIRAGYSLKSAKYIGNENLTKPEIREGIKKQIEELHDNKIAEAAEVMEYLTSVLRGEATSEIVVVVGRGDGVQEAITTLKHPDEKEKLKAAELLGKRYGMFSDKVDINSVIPVVISGEELLED